MSHVNVTTKVDQKTYRMVKVVAGFTDQTMSEFIADVVKRAVDDFDYEQAILENTTDDQEDGNDNDADSDSDDVQEVDNDTDSMVDNGGDDDQEVDNDSDNGGYHDTDSVVENSHGDF